MGGRGRGGGGSSQVLQFASPSTSSRGTSATSSSSDFQTRGRQPWPVRPLAGAYGRGGQQQHPAGVDAVFPNSFHNVFGRPLQQWGQRPPPQPQPEPEPSWWDARRLEAGGPVLSDVAHHANVVHPRIAAGTADGTTPRAHQQSDSTPGSGSAASRSETIVVDDAGSSSSAQRTGTASPTAGTTNPLIEPTVANTGTGHYGAGAAIPGRQQQQEVRHGKMNDQLPELFTVEIKAKLLGQEELFHKSSSSAWPSVSSRDEDSADDDLDDQYYGPCGTTALTFEINLLPAFTPIWQFMRLVQLKLAEECARQESRRQEMDFGWDVTQAAPLEEDQGDIEEIDYATTHAIFTKMRMSWPETEFWKVLEKEAFVLSSSPSAPANAPRNVGRSTATTKDPAFVPTSWENGVPYVYDLPILALFAAPERKGTDTEPSTENRPETIRPEPHQKRRFCLSFEIVEKIIDAQHEQERAGLMLDTRYLLAMPALIAGTSSEAELSSSTEEPPATADIVARR
ncbi:unnamed protein product, partial [Amoebophrya sp. A120]|eukprot:GSA120T00007565001.1